MLLGGAVVRGRPKMKEQREDEDGIGSELH